MPTKVPMRTCRFCHVRVPFRDVACYQQGSYAHLSCLYLRRGEAGIAALDASALATMNVGRMLDAGMSMYRVLELLAQVEERERTRTIRGAIHAAQKDGHGLNLPVNILVMPGTYKGPIGPLPGDTIEGVGGRIVMTHGPPR